MIKKNLILTVLHQYTYPVVEPFIKSLKETGYTGDLVIFVSDSTSKTTKKILAKHGAILIEFNTVYPFIDSYSNVFEDVAPAITINNYRFLFYLKYLLDNPGKYENVMLTDIRDVIFQKDPFAAAEGEHIYFFLEDGVQTFKHKLNFEWLVEATDERTATELLNNVVSCAGVTIGKAPLITNYLNYMTCKLKFREKAQWGLDQGIHNSYIYIEKPPAMQVIPNTGSYVCTLGAYQPYLLNAEDEVVATTGKPFAVVHQYDRHGELIVKVKARFIGSRLIQKMKRLYYLIMP